MQPPPSGMRRFSRPPHPGMGTGFDKNCIYDLGMHHAQDTKFYLAKGYRVIALEANPEMVERAAGSLGDAVQRKQLTLVDRALWSHSNEKIPFFVNPVKDDWSSAFKGWAEKSGHHSTEIQVSTITLNEMFDLYGVPYYIKCDIEGADELFCDQLLEDHRRPAFVSIEAVSLEALAILYAAGYDRVQIVNQAFGGFVKPPDPPREGIYASVRFTGHMSGLFGMELDPDGWVTFSTAAEAYLKFCDLRKQNEKLAHGWLDFHVTHSTTLLARRIVPVPVEIRAAGAIS
jgi:FkbM family methyltransferase